MRFFARAQAVVSHAALTARTLTVQHSDHDCAAHCRPLQPCRRRRLQLARATASTQPPSNGLPQLARAPALTATTLHQAPGPHRGLARARAAAAGPRLGREREHVVKLVLPLLQQPVLVHAAQQRLALKQPLGLLVVQRQQRARGLRRVWRTCSKLDASFAMARHMTQQYCHSHKRWWRRLAASVAVEMANARHPNKEPVGLLLAICKECSNQLAARPALLPNTCSKSWALLAGSVNTRPLHEVLIKPLLLCCLHCTRSVARAL